MNLNERLIKLKSDFFLNKKQSEFFSKTNNILKMNSIDIYNAMMIQHNNCDLNSNFYKPKKGKLTKNETQLLVHLNYN